MSVLVREGWVLGHYDRFKVPAWVSTRWTRDFEASESIPSLGRPFKPDGELPQYPQALKNYDFNTSQMERGHMARHEDNKAWGEDSSEAGCLMSNIVPQHKDMNGEAWNDIENAHRNIVADDSSGIDTVWVISGPIFKDNQAQSLVGNGVGVPESTFKVIGWFDAAGDFQARGYVVKQSDRVRDPAHYLRPIDEIEAATGLDFFHELEDGQESQVEAASPADLWGE